MALPPPDPDAPQEDLYRHARALHEACAEKDAVIRRIKEHIEPWKSDRRMRIMGQILLKEIERIEREERERTESGGR